jgi:hypothetical protein
MPTTYHKYAERRALAERLMRAELDKRGLEAEPVANSSIGTAQSRLPLPGSPFLDFSIRVSVDESGAHSWTVGDEREGESVFLREADGDTLQEAVDAYIAEIEGFLAQAKKALRVEKETV